MHTRFTMRFFAIASALLALVSYVERLYAEKGKLLSRDFEENIEAYEQRVEPRLGVSSARAALSMQLLSQLFTASIALIIARARPGVGEREGFRPG